MTADSPTAVDQPLARRWDPSHDLARLAQSVLFTAAAMVFGLAALLLARRWSDALQKPLEPLGLVVLGLVHAVVTSRFAGLLFFPIPLILGFLLFAGVLGGVGAMQREVIVAGGEVVVVWIWVPLHRHAQHFGLEANARL